MFSPGNKNRNSFTLIELLVVLALVAILSVVVVLTLNPVELIKQARDSNRLSDLATINTALNLFSTDVTSGFMGTSTVVYVSIPDNASSTCGSLGLPALPTGWSYNCVTTANLKKTDGAGWIPVNFQRISSNSPISQLPVDPLNVTSTGNYYTYVSGGSWMLSALPESQKQKTELFSTPHLPKYPGVIAIGNNLNINPNYSGSGLVSYWPFDEGAGSITRDKIDSTRTAGSTTGKWVAGKVGAWALSFATSTYITTGSINMAGSSLTISFWYNPTYLPYSSYFILNRAWPGMYIGYYTSSVQYMTLGTGNGGICDSSAGYVTPGSWNHYAITYNSGTARFYKNGSLYSSCSGTQNIVADQYTIGQTLALYDDFRFYNAALSSSEIKALYNATR